jgi:DNA-binding PadR family transcriptional regulator
VFHILLAVADRERHGYAIIKEVEERTNGKVVLSTGTMYQAIKRLLDDELIEETDAAPGRGSDDERRRYYRLTAFGRKVAQAEVHRMAQLVDIADQKKLVNLLTLPIGAGTR